jgi:hypothetical protein
MWPFGGDGVEVGIGVVEWATFSVWTDVDMATGVSRSRALLL